MDGGERGVHWDGKIGPQNVSGLDRDSPGGLVDRADKGVEGGEVHVIVIDFTLLRLSECEAFSIGGSGKKNVRTLLELLVLAETVRHVQPYLLGPMAMNAVPAWMCSTRPA